MKEKKSHPLILHPYIQTRKKIANNLKPQQ